MPRERSRILRACSKSHARRDVVSEPHRGHRGHAVLGSTPGRRTRVYLYGERPYSATAEVEEMLGREAT